MLKIIHYFFFFRNDGHLDVPVFLVYPIKYLRD